MLVSGMIVLSGLSMQYAQYGVGCSEYAVRCAHSGMIVGADKKAEKIRARAVMNVT